MGNASMRQYVARGSCWIVPAHAPFPGCAYSFTKSRSSIQFFNFFKKKACGFFTASSESDISTSLVELRRLNRNISAWIQETKKWIKPSDWSSTKTENTFRASPRGSLSLILQYCEVSGVPPLKDQERQDPFPAPPMCRSRWHNHWPLRLPLRPRNDCHPDKRN